MQCANIGYPNNNVTSKTEPECNLVTDSEELLHVFEHLVRDKQVYACIVEGNDRALEIEDPKLDTMSL
ncbi:hypothetical protein BPIT_32110 [Candidatus Brocadia pituitae]|nr:hypothetical protein BPIT_32110 [Candidatus Brocadia pituitae]